MIIGIDASRALVKERTGIEEYAYQTIKHLRSVIPATDRVVLYVRKSRALYGGSGVMKTPEIDFELPKNWSVRALWAPRFWTYIRLSCELLLHPVDVLFVPSHVVPPLHPRRTIVTIHGIEYEHYPRAYTWWERFSMRCAIKRSCVWASRIIAVSHATREDIIRIYRIKKEKIAVIHEGVADHPNTEVSNHKAPSSIVPQKPYILFVGRIEERKNIARIIEAFDILKEKYVMPHTIVLAGKQGHGYSRIKDKISKIKNKDSVIETGYVSEERKRTLLRDASVFLFPTLAEGFGLPILEAQVSGIPVVASRIPSHEEIAISPEGDNTVVFVSPHSAPEIADAVYHVLTDDALRNGIIQRGYVNRRRFTWQASARAIAALLAQS